MDQGHWVERQRRAAGPFGSLDASGRTLQASSWAVMQGAQNLLGKALARWRDDQPRALGYVGRAISLPFDDHEGAFPAAYAASAVLFSIVVDELGELPEDDTLWLDAALAVLGETDSTARFPLRDALLAIDQDYDLNGHEHRLLAAAVAPIPSRPELRDMTDLGTDELRAEVIAIMDLCALYLETLEKMAAETTP